MWEESHLTGEDVRALRAGAMDATALLRATRHIAQCADCAAAVRAGIDPQRTAASLRAELADRHLDLEEELFPYVDGLANPAVEEHLRDCARCREDLEDLRAERRRRRRPRRLIVWSLAAAAAIAVIVVLLTRPQLQPQPSPPAAAPVSPFASVVSAALHAGRLDPPPALVALRRDADSLRGTAYTQHPRLAPAGVVLATTRPHFVWSAPPGQAVVSVYDGAKLVAQSGRLHASEWTPDAPLPRGRRYAWEVDVRSAAGAHRIIPSTPDPPALFAIVDEASWNEIEAAHRAGDHVAAGVLEARAGLKDEALSDFDAYLASHPADARVRALAASVHAW